MLMPFQNIQLRNPNNAHVNQQDKVEQLLWATIGNDYDTDKDISLVLSDVAGITPVRNKKK